MEYMVSPEFVGTIYNAVACMWEHYTGACDASNIALFTPHIVELVKQMGGGWVDIGGNANHIMYCWASA